VAWAHRINFHSFDVSRETIEVLNPEEFEDVSRETSSKRYRGQQTMFHVKHSVYG
jgi:hypothetical protein